MPLHLLRVSDTLRIKNVATTLRRLYNTTLNYLNQDNSNYCSHFYFSCCLSPRKIYSPCNWGPGIWSYGSLSISYITSSTGDNPSAAYYLLFEASITLHMYPTEHKWFSFSHVLQIRSPPIKVFHSTCLSFIRREIWYPIAPGPEAW